MESLELNSFLDSNFKDIRKLLKFISNKCYCKDYTLVIKRGDIIHSGNILDDYLNFSNVDTIIIKDEIIVIPHDNYYLCLYNHKGNLDINNVKELNVVFNLLSLFITNDINDEMFLINMSHEIRTPLNVLLDIVNTLIQN